MEKVKFSCSEGRNIIVIPSGNMLLIHIVQNGTEQIYLTQNPNEVQVLELPEMEYSQTDTIDQIIEKAKLAFDEWEKKRFENSFLNAKKF